MLADDMDFSDSEEEVGHIACGGDNCAEDSNGEGEGCFPHETPEEEGLSPESDGGLVRKVKSGKKRKADEFSTYKLRRPPHEAPDFDIKDLENVFNLYSLLAVPEDEFIDWLIRHGYLAAAMVCQKCTPPRQCVKQGRIKNWEPYTWKCNAPKPHELTMRTYSPFKGSHLYMQDTFHFFARFGEKATLLRLANITGMSYRSTTVAKAKYCRRICSAWLLDYLDGTVLCGEVEIDESHFGRRFKHNRGTMRGEPVWIVGLVERRSQKLLCFPVDDRSGPTLEAIIQKYVEPGSTIYTDGWEGYRNLNSLGFNHFVVNHVHGFVAWYVNKATGHVVHCHTNRIEGAWAHAKAHFKMINGTSTANFEGHLAEVCWRASVRGLNSQTAFLELVRAYHPLDSPPPLDVPVPLFPTWKNLRGKLPTQLDEENAEADLEDEMGNLYRNDSDDDEPRQKPVTDTGVQTDGGGSSTDTANVNRPAGSRRKVKRALQKHPKPTAPMRTTVTSKSCPSDQTRHTPLPAKKGAKKGTAKQKRPNPRGKRGWVNLPKEYPEDSQGSLILPGKPWHSQLSDSGPPAPTDNPSDTRRVRGIPGQKGRPETHPGSLEPAPAVLRPAITLQTATSVTNTKPRRTKDQVVKAIRGLASSNPPSRPASLEDAEATAVPNRAAYTFTSNHQHVQTQAAVKALSYKPTPIGSWPPRKVCTKRVSPSFAAQMDDLFGMPSDSEDAEDHEQHAAKDITCTVTSPTAHALISSQEAFTSAAYKFFDALPDEQGPCDGRCGLNGVDHEQHLVPDSQCTNGSGTPFPCGQPVTCVPDSDASCSQTTLPYSDAASLDSRCSLVNSSGQLHRAPCYEESSPHPTCASIDLSAMEKEAMEDFDAADGAGVILTPNHKQNHGQSAQTDGRITDIGKEASVAPARMKGRLSLSRRRKSAASVEHAIVVMDSDSDFEDVPALYKKKTKSPKMARSGTKVTGSPAEGSNGMTCGIQEGARKKEASTAVCRGVPKKAETHPAGPISIHTANVHSGARSSPRLAGKLQTNPATTAAASTRPTQKSTCQRGRGRGRPSDAARPATPATPARGGRGRGGARGGRGSRGGKKRDPTKVWGKRPEGYTPFLTRAPPAPREPYSGGRETRAEQRHVLHMIKKMERREKLAQPVIELCQLSSGTEEEGGKERCDIDVKPDLAAMALKALRHRPISGTPATTVTHTVQRSVATPATPRRPTAAGAHETHTPQAVEPPARGLQSGGREVVVHAMVHHAQDADVSVPMYPRPITGPFSHTSGPSRKVHFQADPNVDESD